ncbi:hypothetical protein BT93_E2393 [Corymbia citriodora subsp. variegata]|nr:hypothetical protein BT93_E2393 [Corymbia citriodora subsp. variegata]
MSREKVVLATAFLALALVFAANQPADAAQPPPQSLAWLGCPDSCGNLTNIPYPFGIGPGCFLDPWYEIDCQQTLGISTPVLKNLSVVVLDISLPQNSYSPGRITISQPILYSHPNCMTNRQNDTPVDLTGRNGIFRYALDRNSFVAGGCDNQALMVINDTPRKVVGCASSCGGEGTLGLDQCSNGTSCCVASTIDDIGKYRVEFQTFKGKDIAQEDKTCRYAFLVKHPWLYKADLNSLPSHVPVVLEWAITQHEEQLLSKQSNWRANGSSGSCHRDVKPRLHNLLYCSCNQGYRGNCFLPNGCQGEFRISTLTLHLSPYSSSKIK